MHFRSAYEGAGQRQQKNNNPSRDGLYIDPAFTPGNAANLVRDLNFSGTIVGNVHAQPLYIEGGPNGPMIIAVTASNNIYSLNASTAVDGTIRGQSSTTYHTSQGTYFVFRAASNQLKAYKVTATTPPTIVSAWSVTQNGQGSPWVTTTDGTNNAIVWVVGAQVEGQLHGYNGDTGAVIYAGADVMSGTRKWNSGMAARGSIYVANDNKVYAFRVPGGTPTPSPTASPTPTATATRLPEAA